MTKEKIPAGSYPAGYIKELYELEISVLEQNKILDCITYHLTNDTPDLKKEAGREAVKKKSLSETFRAAFFLCVPCILIILIISAVTALFNSVSKELLKNVEAGLAGSISTYYKITVVLCIIVCVFVCYMRIMQDRDDAEKNRVILIQNHFQDYKASLQFQYNIGRQNLIRTNQILEARYNTLDIAHRYRGLVPIASIYQYLSDGRCLNLEEACDLYESESEQGLVARDIDTLEERQGRTGENQSMLYNAVKEADHTYTKIRADIQRLADEARIIPPESELRKYNAVISAQLSAENI